MSAFFKVKKKHNHSEIVLVLIRRNFNDSSVLQLLRAQAHTESSSCHVRKHANPQDVKMMEKSEHNIPGNLANDSPIQHSTVSYF